MTDASTAASKIVEGLFDQSTGENGLWQAFARWSSLSAFAKSRYRFGLEMIVHGHIKSVIASLPKPEAPCALTIYETADEILSFVSSQYDIRLDDPDDHRETATGISAIMRRQMPTWPKTPPVDWTDNHSISVTNVLGASSSVSSDNRLPGMLDPAVSAVSLQLEGFLRSLDDTLAVRGQMSGLALQRLQEKRDVFAKSIVSTLKALSGGIDNEAADKKGRIDIVGNTPS